MYLPLYRRVRTLLGQTGLLYAGDCKMAALETRAEIAANRDFYLTRLPLTGTAQAQFAATGSRRPSSVTGPRRADRDPPRGRSRTLGRGYEFERPQTAVVGEAEHTWTERVQVIRSESAAESQARPWTVG